MADAEVKEASKLPTIPDDFLLLDEDEEYTLKPNIATMVMLAEERNQIYRNGCADQIEGGDVLFSVMDEEENFEHIIRFRDGKFAEIVVTTSIAMDVVTPTSLVEYCFEDEVWRLSELSCEDLDGYRSTKFKYWVEEVRKETCRKGLVGRLRNGLVTTVFDHSMFPTPDDMKEKYQVTDPKTGKIINISHPVKELRVWNAKEQKYDPVETQLDNLPEDPAKFYEDLLVELSGFYPEVIAEVRKLLAAKEEATS